MEQTAEEWQILQPQLDELFVSSAYPTDCAAGDIVNSDEENPSTTESARVSPTEQATGEWNILQPQLAELFPSKLQSEPSWSAHSDCSSARMSPPLEEATEESHVIQPQLDTDELSQSSAKVVD